MIALGIILFVTVLTIDLISDYRKWLNKKRVKHTLEGLIRIIFLIPSIICFSWKLGLWQTFIPCFMIMFWYWLCFDSIYNKLRGFNWFFTGSDDPDDAIADNILQRLKLWQQVTLKIGGAIIFTAVYIFLQ